VIAVDQPHAPIGDPAGSVFFGIWVMACPLAEMFSFPAPAVMWRASSGR